MMGKVIPVKTCWGKDSRCPYASGWDWGKDCPDMPNWETLFCAYERKMWPHGVGHKEGEKKLYDDIVEDKIVGHFNRPKVEGPDEENPVIIEIPDWCLLSERGE